MRLDMNQLGQQSVLAGALSGRRLLGILLNATSVEPGKAEPAFLDFRNIEVATASFLRESVLTFRDLTRGRRSNFYPVIANANDLVTDELLELMRSRNDVIMTCGLDESGVATTPKLIGDLEPKQRMTFELVCGRGETDAELMRQYGGTRTQTAWNNRLAALAALGVLVEINQGRNKRYKPLLQGA
jgi:hypothetical protein